MCQWVAMPIELCLNQIHRRRHQMRVWGRYGGVGPNCGATTVDQSVGPIPGPTLLMPSLPHSRDQRCNLVLCLSSCVCVLWPNDQHQIVADL